MTKKKVAITPDYSVEERILALYDLQKINTEIDEINKVKGELPLEVEDLEDEVEGLKTRAENILVKAEELEQMINQRKGDIDQANILIKKYEEQLNNVRNNREFDSLNKEIEYQKLEIELSEKRIKEHTAEIKLKKAQAKETEAERKDRQIDLDMKRKELDGIEKDTAKDMAAFEKQKDKAQEKIDQKMLKAYNKIRENVRNGLAVVPITRDACGGCYNRIPPQRQFEIRQNRKIVMCEYCGRIIVSDLLDQDPEEQNDAKE